MMNQSRNKHNQACVMFFLRVFIFLLDFTSISNAIREDAEEAEDDEKQANPIKNSAADR